MNFLTINGSVTFYKASSFRISLLFSLAVAFCANGVLLLLWIDHNKPRQIVYKIKIGKLNYIKPAELLQISKLEIGKSYSKHDLRKIENLLEAHPAILQADIRQEDDSLYLNLQEQTCMALVEYKMEDFVYDVDAFGNILSHDEMRCKNVPLLRGSFQKENINQKNSIFFSRFYGEQIERLLVNLALIRENYPDIYERISEVHVNTSRDLTIFLSSANLRVELPPELDIQIVRKLYAAVAWLLNEKTSKAWVDLRGTEAILHTN